MSDARKLTLTRNCSMGVAPVTGWVSTEHNGGQSYVPTKYEDLTKDLINLLFNVNYFKTHSEYPSMRIPFGNGMGNIDATQILFAWIDFEYKQNITTIAPLNKLSFSYISVVLVVGNQIFSTSVGTWSYLANKFPVEMAELYNKYMEVKNEVSEE